MGQRGPYAKTAAVQEQILAAALEVIATNGYSNTSLRQIADAVGVTQPALLHHFGSKDGLLTAILTRRDELGIDEINGGRDAIDGFVHLVQTNASVPGLVALFAAIVGVGVTDQEGSPARVFTQTHYPGLVDVVTGAVTRRQSAGSLRADVDPQVFARLFIAAIDGLQTQWLLDSQMDMGRHVELLLDLAAAPAQASR